MFLIQTETDLLNAFRPRDRMQVELPKDFTFPLLVRDYRAWLQPSGVRTYLVLLEPHSRRPMGITFRRDQQGGGSIAARMCDWCHSYGSSEEIGLLTAEATSKRRVGVSLCLDLRCSEKLETAANMAGRNPRPLHQHMVERILRFAQEGLGISYVPAA